MMITMMIPNIKVCGFIVATLSSVRDPYIVPPSTVMTSNISITIIIVLIFTAIFIIISTAITLTTITPTIPSPTYSKHQIYVIYLLLKCY